MSRGALYGYASVAAVSFAAIAQGTAVLCAAAPPHVSRIPVALIALGVPLFAFYGAAARDQWREARRAAACAKGPAAQPLPAQAPTFEDKPLPWHMAASRKHLPSTLPVGWSVPLALTDMGGIWMIDVQEFSVLVAYATVRDRIMLAVTIVPPRGAEVTETFALGVLKHLRGVGTFVPSDIDENVPGARMYLGALRPEGLARRSALN